MGGESFVKSWKLVKRMDQFISLMVHKSGASPVEVGNLSTIIYKVLYYIPAGRWGFLNYQLLGVSGHFCSEIQPVQGKECYGSESPQRWKKAMNSVQFFGAKLFPHLEFVLNWRKMVSPFLVRLIRITNSWSTYYLRCGLSWIMDHEF